MSTRKEIYSKIEKMEGGEAIRDALKALFQEDDTKLQELVDAGKTSKTDYDTKLTDLTGELEALKASGENTVPKTEMETQVSAIQTMLDTITTERDEIKTQNAQNEVDKKNGELNTHFSKSVLDSFGSKNTEMAVGFGMSSGAIAYTEAGEMSYNGKLGDDGIEAFKTDNSHLVQNKGTGTSGGQGGGQADASFEALRAQMMRD
jgi:hypothetical protein